MQSLQNNKIKNHFHLTPLLFRKIKLKVIIGTLVKQEITSKLPPANHKKTSASFGWRSSTPKSTFPWGIRECHL